MSRIIYLSDIQIEHRKDKVKVEKKSITKHGDFIENDSQINAVDCHSHRWTD